MMHVTRFIQKVGRFGASRGLWGQLQVPPGWGNRRARRRIQSQAGPSGSASRSRGWGRWPHALVAHAYTSPHVPANIPTTHVAAHAVDLAAMEDGEEELMPGVVLRVLSEGNGPQPEYGQVVLCDFKGNLKNGSGFEDVRDRRIRIGDGDVPPALELALKKMRANERAQVSSESRFAFGPQGRPAKKGGSEIAVPPDADVEWLIETRSLGATKAAGEMSPEERLKEAENRKRLGNEHFSYESWTKAAKSYEEALKASDLNCYESGSEMHHNAIQVYLACANNLTLCLMKMQSWVKAKEACIHVLEVDGANLKALFRASQISMTLHNYEEAAAALNRAYELYPDSAEVARQQRQLAHTKAAYLRKEKKMSAKMGGFMLRSDGTSVPSSSGEAASSSAAVDGNRSSRTCDDDASANTTTPSAGPEPKRWWYAGAATIAALLIVVTAALLLRWLGAETTPSPPPLEGHPEPISPLAVAGDGRGSDEEL